MRGRLLVGTIALWGVIATGNATPTTWSDSQTLERKTDSSEDVSVTRRSADFTFEADALSGFARSTTVYDDKGSYRIRAFQLFLPRLAYLNAPGRNTAVVANKVFSVSASASHEHSGKAQADSESRQLRDTSRSEVSNNSVLDGLPRDFFLGRAGSMAQGDPATAGSITTVPEPGTLALLGMGLFGVGFATRRRGSR